MGKLSVSTLVTLDGVIQDPGGFGETSQGGWGNPYFTEEAQQDAYEHLMASDYFLCGRVTYELLSKTWGKINGSAVLMQTLMEHDLIDEYRIWVHPFVIGGGKRLFTDGGQATKLRHAGTKTLSSGVAVLAYTPTS